MERKHAQELPDTLIEIRKLIDESKKEIIVHLEIEEEDHYE